VIPRHRSQGDHCVFLCQQFGNGVYSDGNALDSQSIPPFGELNQPLGGTSKDHGSELQCLRGVRQERECHVEFLSGRACGGIEFFVEVMAFDFVGGLCPFVGVGISVVVFGGSIVKVERVGRGVDNVCGVAMMYMHKLLDLMERSMEQDGFGERPLLVLERHELLLLR